MDLVPTLVNSMIVALVGVLITWVTRTQQQQLREDLRDVRSELKQDIRDVRAELGAQLGTDIGSVRAEIGSVRTEIAALRSDLTQVALAVGAKTRPQTG